MIHSWIKNDVPVSVLIIEDVSTEAKAVELALENANTREEFRFFEAQWLSEGLEILSKERIDIVLADLSLPDAKGTRTVFEIKEKFPDIPLVVLSGQTGAEIVFKTFQAGAEGFLLKGETSGLDIKYAIYQALARHNITTERHESDRHSA